MEAEVGRVSLGQIIKQANKLSDEDQGELINSLRISSRLLVFLGKKNLSVLEQIRMMGWDELGEVLHAVAERMNNTEI
jgi:hypothetical protein